MQVRAATVEKQEEAIEKGVLGRARAVRYIFLVEKIEMTGWARFVI
jgi:hypothetical protein